MLGTVRKLVAFANAYMTLLFQHTKPEPPSSAAACWPAEASAATFGTLKRILQICALTHKVPSAVPACIQWFVAFLSLLDCAKLLAVLHIGQTVECNLAHLLRNMCLQSLTESLNAVKNCS